jgi:probable phage protein
MDLMRYGWEEGRLKLKKAIGKIAIDELVGKRCTVDQIPDTLVMRLIFIGFYLVIQKIWLNII